MLHDAQAAVIDTFANPPQPIAAPTPAPSTRAASHAPGGCTAPPIDPASTVVSTIMVECVHVGMPIRVDVGLPLSVCLRVCLSLPPLLASALLDKG